MRDLLLGSIIAYCVIRAFASPAIGILSWTVLSIMNPHQYGWLLSTMPVAAAVAIATMVGILITKEERSFPWSGETMVLVAFMVWVCITLPFSNSFEGSIDMWKKVMKIDFMILLAMLVLHSKQQIMALAWVLAGSIGFFGFKGGLFTLLTGGNYRVWGPDSTFIEGNNEIALALVIVIPLLRFLQMNVSKTWVKHGLTLVMLLSAIAALGTHSRGALLAIAAMSLVMWWRSKNKFWTGLLLLAVGASMLAFMPEQWTARMETIGEYDQDESAKGRINAWWMAWNLASHNFFGGGFDIYTPQMFAIYAPNPADIHAAHSIYFQVLGEHGFVGLFLFMLMWFMVWRSAGKLQKVGKQREETRWVADLGAMCQVSLAGYAVGGAFLSLAYFDLPYNILILVVLACRWVEQERWKTDTNDLSLFGRKQKTQP
ncbi:O-antigen ligase family protein [Chitinimonas naiadis]